MRSPVSPKVELVHELHRQEENCSYTAASLYGWMKVVRFLKGVAIAVQASFGALATWKVLTHDYELLTAVFALVAAVIPPLLSALKVNEAIDGARSAAAEFTALRDRFRRAAQIDSSQPFPEFKAGADILFDRLDEARKVTSPAPEWLFRRAQRKMQRGDFTHDYDQKREGR